jgi:hypothetical protein
MARTVLLGVIVVVFGAISSLAAPDPQPEIAGMYRCNGVNPDGSPYEGVAEIAKIDGTYRILWTLSDQTSVLGVGIVSNGVFAVSYFGGAPAVALYKIDGEKLVGEWTMGGKEGAVYAETLQKFAEGERPANVPRMPGPRARPQVPDDHNHEAPQAAPPRGIRL